MSLNIQIRQIKTIKTADMKSIMENKVLRFSSGSQLGLFRYWKTFIIRIISVEVPEIFPESKKSFSKSP